MRSSNSSDTIYTTGYRKPTHTNRYLHWNSNHPTFAKTSVIQAITHRVQMVCSSPELIAREMDYLYRVLCRNNYLDWFLKKTNTRPQVDQLTIQEITKEVFISVPYIPRFSEEFRRSLKDTKVQIIFKGCNTLQSLLMHLKDKILPHFWQDITYQWMCPEETCNSSYV